MGDWGLYVPLGLASVAFVATLHERVLRWRQRTLFLEDRVRALESAARDNGAFRESICDAIEEVRDRVEQVAPRQLGPYR